MEWRKKRVLVIGAARQGKVLASFLSNKGAKVLITDQRDKDVMTDVIKELSGFDVDWHLGSHPLDLLNGIDFVAPSGGVPLNIPIVEEAISRNIPLTNDSQIFLEEALCKVIGITGSAGKTTTTSLVVTIIQAAIDALTKIDFSKVWVGGNIGNPLLANIDLIDSEDIAVMELSSFQLEVMTKSPNIAVVLNISPNHLDRHDNMTNYISAKASILSFQQSDDVAILNRDDDATFALAKKSVGRVHTFGINQPKEGQEGSFVRNGSVWIKINSEESEVIPVALIKLLGQHNLYNVLAACAIASVIKIPTEIIKMAIAEFSSVPHRLEFIRSWAGADWYNDSIATAPQRAIASIKSFSQPIVLLLGGQDKNLPWDELFHEIRSRVDHLIVFGEIGDFVAKVFSNQATDGQPHTIAIKNKLADAVQAAVEVVEQGDVVILSPGGSSYDEFKDFEDRGEFYKKMVMAL